MIFSTLFKKSGKSGAHFEGEIGENKKYEGKKIERNFMFKNVKIIPCVLCAFYYFNNILKKYLIIIF